LSVTRWLSIPIIDEREVLATSGAIRATRSQRR